MQENRFYLEKRMTRRKKKHLFLIQLKKKCLHKVIRSGFILFCLCFHTSSSRKVNSLKNEMNSLIMSEFHLCYIKIYTIFKKLKSIFRIIKVRPHTKFVPDWIWKPNHDMTPNKNKNKITTCIFITTSTMLLDISICMLCCKI